MTELSIKSRFGNLLKLVENQQNELKAAVRHFENTEISAEYLATLISKSRPEGVSQDELILQELRRVELEFWSNRDKELNSRTNLANNFGEGYSEIIYVYDNVLDLLKRLVSVCSDPPTSDDCKAEKLEEINVHKNAVYEGLNNIPVKGRMDKIVDDVKNQIERIFDSQISDLLSLF